MKILIISQHYYPEPFRITDICEELVKRGHEVSVITGLPNYPKGEIYPGYRDKSKREEGINGVKVHRCFTIGRKGGVVKRVLNYYSFALSSKAYKTVRRNRERYRNIFLQAYRDLRGVFFQYPRRDGVCLWRRQPCRRCGIC